MACLAGRNTRDAECNRGRLGRHMSEYSEREDIRGLSSEMNRVSRSPTKWNKILRSRSWDPSSMPGDDLWSTRLAQDSFSARYKKNGTLYIEKGVCEPQQVRGPACRRTRAWASRPAEGEQHCRARRQAKTSANQGARHTAGTF